MVKVTIELPDGFTAAVAADQAKALAASKLTADQFALLFVQRWALQYTHQVQVQKANTEKQTAKDAVIVALPQIATIEQAFATKKQAADAALASGLAEIVK